MAGLQPATLESDIFNQFDILNVSGHEQLIYFCLLPPCFETAYSCKSHQSWEVHRMEVHKIPVAENIKIPNEREIRDWVQRGKPRPYVIPERFPSNQTASTPIRTAAAAIDMEIFSQFDVRVKDGKERYFCLLPPCREKGCSSADHRTWKIHRAGVHDLQETSSVPGKRMVRKWVEEGKPVAYRIPARAGPRKGRTIQTPEKPVNIASPAGSSAMEVEKRQPASANSNIFCQFDVKDNVDGKPQFFCLLPGCIEKGHSLSRRQNLVKHRKNVHKLGPDEHFPSSTTISTWRARGKPPQYENPQTSRDLARDATRDAPRDAARDAVSGREDARVVLITSKTQSTVCREYRMRRCLRDEDDSDDEQLEDSCQKVPQSDDLTNRFSQIGLQS